MRQQKSLRAIAKELEVSPSYLSMILNGQRSPSSQLRDKLCSQGLFTNEAIIRLGSKHSTAELHPLLGSL